MAMITPSIFASMGRQEERSQKSFEENLAETLQVAQFGREQARQNAIASMELEREMFPELYQLRRNAFGSLLEDLGGSTRIPQGMMDRLIADFYVDSAPQLLRDARQRVAEDFALGGQLPLDVQRQVSRASMAGAGRTGVTGQTAQDIVARDLGLSGTALREARTDRALQTGIQEAEMDRADETRRLSQAGTIQSLLNVDADRRMAIAGLSSGIPMPQAGIDPGSLASYNIALTTSQMQADAQREAARAQASAQRSSGLFGFLGRALGGVLGGPVGAGIADAIF